MKPIILILACSLLPLNIAAQSINARLSTSMQTYERSVSATETEQHLRLTQALQLTISQLANNRLSLRLYGIGANDFSTGATDDPLLRFYNAYLQWRESHGALKLVKLGRQRIYAGVAYGTIDGVDATFRIGDKFQIGGFAGLLVTDPNGVELATWDDAHAIGMRLKANNLFGSRVLLSFMQRDRTPATYVQPGQYSNQLLSWSSEEVQLLGADVLRDFGEKGSVYGRLDYDAYNERIRRGQVGLSFAPEPKWEVNVDFIHRAPLIAANSIFSVFESKPSQNVGLRLKYKLPKEWAATGTFGFTSYDGDESLRFGVSAMCRYGSIGYGFRNGYGGKNNGFYGAVNYPFSQKMVLYGSAGWARYSVFDNDGADVISITQSIGVSYRPGQKLTLDLLGQNVHNRFYDADVRVFVKGSYWLFHKVRRDAGKK